MASSTAFACRMDALSSEERERSRVLREQLVEETRATAEVSDGYRFRYDGDAFLKAAEWISLERRCCPFLDFAIEWKRGDEVDVIITGAPGVKEFLRAEMPELPRGWVAGAGNPVATPPECRPRTP